MWNNLLKDLKLFFKKHRSLILPSDYSDENSIKSDFRKNTFVTTYLTTLTCMHTIMKSRGLVPTHTAFNSHKGVGRLLMRFIVQLNFF